MVTYEITATVRAELCAAYERYMQARHIPDLLATGAFAAASLARAEPGRYRVRYEAHDRAALDRYLAVDAPRLRRHFAETFPEGVEVAREEWSMLANWPPASTPARSVATDAPPAFRANDELALHVPDPAAAAGFYAEVLGCPVVHRDPDVIEVAGGALRLFFVRDPERTHDAVVPSFDVPDRAAALARLQAAGCALIPIGPHAPDGVYVRDPFGVVFDVIERAPGMADRVDDRAHPAERG